MKVAAASLALLLSLAACSSPLIARREWRVPGEPPVFRDVEFEKHKVTETPGGIHVALEHRETFMPWHLVRPYLGETLHFEFPVPGEDGEPVPVTVGSYSLRAYAYVHAKFREGTVTPTPEDSESLGDFRLVFDGADIHDRKVVIAFSGRLRR